MREDCTCTCHGRTVECEPCYRLHTIVARMDGFIDGMLERLAESAVKPGTDGIAGKLQVGTITSVQTYWNTLVQTVAGDSSEWPAIERVQPQRLQLVPGDYTCASCGVTALTRSGLADHHAQSPLCRAYYARVGLEAPVLS